MIGNLVRAAFAFGLIGAAQAAAQVSDGQVFGDWTVRCREAPDGSGETCFLVQEFIPPDQPERGPFMVVTLRPAPEPDNLVMTINLPLGVFLAANPAAKVDEGEQFDLTWQACVPNAGCIAATGIDAAREQSLRAGIELLVGFKPSPQERTQAVPFSLSGVTAGLNALGQ